MKLIFEYINILKIPTKFSFSVHDGSFLIIVAVKKLLAATKEMMTCKKFANLPKLYILVLFCFHPGSIGGDIFRLSVPKSPAVSFERLSNSDGRERGGNDESSVKMCQKI